jgi:hypothetical protein
MAREIPFQSSRRVQIIVFLRGFSSGHFGKLLNCKLCGWRADVTKGGKDEI